jgi:hypothetical protein
VAAVAAAAADGDDGMRTRRVRPARIASSWLNPYPHHAFQRIGDIAGF